MGKQLLPRFVFIQRIIFEKSFCDTTRFTRPGNSGNAILMVKVINTFKDYYELPQAK